MFLVNHLYLDPKPDKLWAQNLTPTQIILWNISKNPANSILNGLQLDLSPYCTELVGQTSEVKENKSNDFHLCSQHCGKNRRCFLQVDHNPLTFLEEGY